MSQQPNKPYNPLFNRTYLKYLGFAVAIVIVILSERPPAPLEHPVPTANASSQLKVLRVENLQQQRLILSFATYPALTQNSKITRHLAAKALRDKTRQYPNIHAVLWTYDRLEVELRWTQDKGERVNISLQNTLYRLFNVNPDFNNQSNRKLIAAQYYLENKQADTALLAALEEGLAGQYRSPTKIAQLLYTPATAILITDRKTTAKFIADLDQQIAQLLQTQLTALPESFDWQAKSTHIEQRNRQHNLLIATELEVLNNLQGKIELLANFVLGDILNRQLPTKKIRFRLIKQQIFKRGYQIIVLSSDTVMTDSLLDIINDEVNNANFDDELTLVKDRLIKQYTTLIDDRERLFKLYSKKQFYRLKTQSAAEYTAQLNSITSEQVRSLMRRFSAEPTYTIFLKPS